MRLLIPQLVFVVFYLSAASCHKRSNCVTSGGGKGGSGLLSVIPTHRGLFIDTCTVYIKYGTLDAPADGKYDDSAVSTVANDTPRVTFDSLRTGIYYLLGHGYHAGYSPPNTIGGSPYNMCSEKNESIYLPTY